MHLFKLYIMSIIPLLKNDSTNICSKIIKIEMMNGLCFQYEKLWKYAKEEVNLLCIVDQNHQSLWLQKAILEILKVFSRWWFLGGLGTTFENGGIAT